MERSYLKLWKQYLNEDRVDLDDLSQDFVLVQGSNPNHKLKPGTEIRTEKSADGTITNKFTNTKDETVIQVKTPDGRYYEKVILPSGQVKPTTSTSTSSKTINLYQNVEQTSNWDTGKIQAISTTLPDLAFKKYAKTNDVWITVYTNNHGQVTLRWNAQKTGVFDLFFTETKVDYNTWSNNLGNTAGMNKQVYTGWSGDVSIVYNKNLDAELLKKYGKNKNNPNAAY